MRRENRSAEPCEARGSTGHPLALALEGGVELVRDASPARSADVEINIWLFDMVVTPAHPQPARKQSCRSHPA
jgi:hypothetical protein